MIRRFLTRVFILILLGALGYNAWLLHESQAQVAQLQAELRAVSKRRPPVQAAGAIPNDWTDRAERHAALARAAAQRGDISTAQHELSLSAAAAQRAVEEPALRTEGQIKRMQTMLKSAQTQVTALAQRAHEGLDAVQGRHHAP